MYRRIFMSFFSLLFILTACTSGEIQTPTTQTLSISLANHTAVVGSTTTQPFTATFSDGSSAAAVMWSLSATDKGTIAPTVGASTTYTPPATGTAGVVTLTATGNGKSAIATISLTAAATPPAMDSEFNITLRYLDDNLSAAKKVEFEKAVKVWETVITVDIADVDIVEIAANDCDAPGDSLFSRPFNGSIDDLQIDVVTISQGTDNAPLAAAGPCILRIDGRSLPIHGTMTINSDYLNEPSFVSTIVHEIGHILGIGTMWEPPDNDFLSYTGKTATTNCGILNPIPDDLGYTGAKAVAEYAKLGGTGNIPVENSAGAGSDCSHWSQSVLPDEVMSTSEETPDDALSRLTIAALDDLGYTVDYSKAVAYAIPSCSPNCLQTVSHRGTWHKVLFPKFTVNSEGQLIPLD